MKTSEKIYLYNKIEDKISRLQISRSLKSFINYKIAEK